MVTESSLEEFGQICPPELIFKKNEEKKVWIFHNGSRLLYRSADDPDSIRGLEVGGLWYDEGAKSPSDEAWKIGIGRLSQRGMPNRAYCTTTPKGHNWLYKFFVEDAKPDTDVIYSTTMDNRTNLPEGYIESLEQQYSGAFYRQELLAQFVGFEGLVYPEFSPISHIMERGTKGLRHIAGVDFGYTNPTVFLAIAVDNDDCMHVCEEIYQSGRTLEQMKDEILRLHGKYGIEAYFCDPSSPDLIATLRSWGLSAREANNDILSGIMEISSRLPLRGDRPRLTFDKGCSRTIEEMGQYRYPDAKANRNPEEKPIKLYDHAMDALRYAAMSLRKTTSTSRFQKSAIAKRSW